MSNRLIGSVNLTPAGNRFELHRTPQGQYVVWDKVAGHRKIAEEGDFEQNFFQLAFTYIRDKIPNLLDYMLGFEVVERNDEGTNAVGLFQFDVNGREIYAPVFYSNGELKGSELLYLKDQDIFRPNEENWVDHIMNKRPMELGDPAELTEQDLRISSPDISGLYKTDSGKLASAPGSLVGMLGLAKIENKEEEPTKAKPSLPEEPEDGSEEDHSRGMQDGDPKKPVDYADPEKRSVVEEMQGFGEDPSWGDLLGFIQANTQKTASVILGTLAKSPELHKWAVEYYGDDLYTALEQVKEAEENNLPALETDLPKVRVFTSPMASGVAEFLNDDEKGALIENGIAFADRRTDDEKAVPYHVEESCSLTSPNEPGVYRLLLQGGAWCDAIILPGIMGVEHEFPSMVDCSVPTVGGCGSLAEDPTYVQAGKDAIVYDLDEDKAAIAAPKDLLVKAQYGADKLQTEIDKLPTVKSMGITEAPEDMEWKPGKIRKYYIIIDPITLKPTHAIKTRGKLTRDDGVIEYQLESYDTPFNTIIITDRVSRCSISSNTLFCPPDAKTLVWSRKEGASSPSLFPGSQEDFDKSILKDTPVVKLSKIGSDYLIIDGYATSPFMDKVAALKWLVVRDHMDVKAAHELVEQADKDGRVTVNLVKKSFLPMGGEVEFPTIPDPAMTEDPALGIPVMPPQEQLVPAMAPSVGDPTTDKIMEQAHPGSPQLDDPALNQNSVNSILQAAETGQRDVFDVSMITQLLQSSDIDPVVQRYVGDLEKALDRLGRLYFLILWHHDEFADRFGAEELPELEDSLKNVFNALGELTLKLKEREIESDSGSAVETDLSEMM